MKLLLILLPTLISSISFCHIAEHDVSCKKNEAFYHEREVVIALKSNSSCMCEFTIPNVFTPNGDGTNDQFRVSGDCEVTSMKIFNRWGQLQFSDQGYTFYWDGRTQAGIEAVSGTYYYVISIGSEDHSGQVMLER